VRGVIILELKYIILLLLPEKTGVRVSLTGIAFKRGVINGR
jgi:hypothetical protein